MLSIPLASLKSTPHTGKANQSISSNAAVRLDYFACHCKNFCLSTPSRLFSSPAKLKLKLVHNHLKPHFSSCSMYVQDQHSRPILSYVLASTLVTTAFTNRQLDTTGPAHTTSSCTGEGTATNNTGKQNLRAQEKC